MTQEETRQRLLYRASNGQDFGFEFDLRAESGWRIYITAQPNYGSRSRAALDVHRYRDERGHYICWNRRIDSFRDAQQVAAAWAEATLHYIRTGNFTVPGHAPAIGYFTVPRHAPAIGYYDRPPARSPVPAAQQREQPWWRRRLARS